MPDHEGVASGAGTSDPAGNDPGTPFGSDPDASERPERPRRPVRRRRAKRSGGAAWLWLIVALVVVFALSAAAWYGLRAAGERAEATRRLDEGLQLLKDADEVVVAADTIIGGDISSDTASQVVETDASLSTAQEQLNRAAELFALAREDLRPEDVALADAARASAQARSTMLAKAGPLMEANAKASLALAPSTSAWDLMLEAQTLADGSVKQYNLHTEAGVKESDKLIAQAEAKLKEAHGLMSEAASDFPEAGLGVYITYADLELSALAKAKEINAKWLAGDKSEANEMLTEFNRRESKASSLGTKLEAPSLLIGQAFDLLTMDNLPAYQDARDAATKADQALNTAAG